jgi:hypothetical protein
VANGVGEAADPGAAIGEVNAQRTPLHSNPLALEKACPQVDFSGQFCEEF